MATQATIVEIQPVQLAARPIATVVVPITLLLHENHSRVPPAECTLSTRCQVESEDDPAFAFHLKDSSNRGPTVKANIGGVDMQILVDSGATKNIVGVTTWEWLK